jgi:hypothetical protein
MIWQIKLWSSDAKKTEKKILCDASLVSIKRAQLSSHSMAERNPNKSEKNQD